MRIAYPDPQKPGMPLDAVRDNRNTLEQHSAMRPLPQCDAMMLWRHRLVAIAILMSCAAVAQSQEFWTNVYPCGSLDIHGQSMYGIQMMYLVPHKGKLFAANGTQGETQTALYPKASQVLVLDSANGRWRVDLQFTTDNPRVSFLGSFTFENDRNGAVLNPPVTLLLAAPSQIPKRFVTWIRNDSTGQWRATDTLRVPDAPSNVQPRAITLYRDAVTGRQDLYVGIEGGGVFRGGYEPTPPARISWGTTPEFVPPFAWQRVLGFASANGRLYCALSSSGDGQFSDVKDSVAHIYERIDGSHPSWRRIYTTEPALPWEDIRGLTAVPDPVNTGKQRLIFTWNNHVYTIDPSMPAADGKATVEIDIRTAVEEQTGVRSQKIVAAYNRFVPFRLPPGNDTVWLAGLAVYAYPAMTNAPNLNGWLLDGLYLTRRRSPAGFIDYRVHSILQNTAQGIADTLLAVRDFAVSPFPEDKEAVLYACGLDHQAMPMSCAAWMYRGVFTQGPTLIGSVSDVDPIELYPNPTSSHLFLRCARPTNARIIDMLGRTAWRGRIDGSATIDASGWTPGMYFLLHSTGAFPLIRK